MCMPHCLCMSPLDYVHDTICVCLFVHICSAGNVCMFMSNTDIKVSVDQSQVELNKSINNIHSYLTSVPQVREKPLVDLTAWYGNVQKSKVWQHLSEITLCPAPDSYCVRCKQTPKFPSQSYDSGPAQHSAVSIHLSQDTRERKKRFEGNAG